MSEAMQTATMLAVLGSFGMANFGYEGALTLWTEGGEAIGMLVAFGVGLKMASRGFDRYVDKKYPVNGITSTVTTTTNGEQ